MARPNPPGVSSTPLGRGFLFLFQTLRGATRSICCKRKEKVARSSGGARRAGSEGERGRGKRASPGRRPGVKRPLSWPLGGGRSRSEGGPVTIYFDRPPPLRVGHDVRKGGRSRSVSRPTPSRGGAGQSISRPAPPDIATGPPPRSDNFI